MNISTKHKCNKLDDGKPKDNNELSSYQSNSNDMKLTLRKSWSDSDSTNSDPLEKKALPSGL